MPIKDSFSGRRRPRFTPAKVSDSQGIKRDSMMPVRSVSASGPYRIKRKDVNYDDLQTSSTCSSDVVISQDSFYEHIITVGGL